MNERKTFLVFGASGQTGRHFIALALREGHAVRALARRPDKITLDSPGLTVRRGSIDNPADWADLVPGADYIVAMLGDKETQKTKMINTAFVRELVPIMRRHGVTRFLYQAGGLSRVPGRRLSPLLWAFRATVARSFEGQHRDNEAVMRYLTEEAADLEWMVHRAGIGSDGPSKGTLERSADRISIATFRDCADYSYRTVMDAGAVRTCDASSYRR
ncbi:NmrA family transcriptional regulator [Actinoplanes philippinensis]|uniref:NAD(P)H-binding n=1 Tax=Actinoplanes philippinensis TaxID=35752 RepID=A0A1I1ZE77_9ACTN|nr:NAD(P)H-binding protein [Actinoplanes philippinensis]GIE75530.1 NmrA family transcriptional regulator [Actinoplanes philippinensis]SFE30051.1 NAD(P)H-binding [Actinoplanes philippinensis]